MNTDHIDITGLDRAAVLAALYNASRPQGMGFLRFKPEDMTVSQAAELLKETDYFDYLQGRVMKVRVAGNALSPWGYDRDNGPGAAARAIDTVRAKAAA